MPNNTVAAAEGEVLLQAFRERGHWASPGTGQGRATDRRASMS